MMEPVTYSRLDAEASGRYKRGGAAKPTRAHRTMEIALFAVFTGLMILAGLALYASYSPSFRVVPNRFEEGLQADRLNLLVIGVGGDAHVGGGKDLADALMLVSLKPSTGEAALISVPRDLYTRIGRYGTHRINMAHSIGNQTSYPGGGAKLTIDTVSQVFDEPIHAFVRLDFAAFEKIIDDIGGIEITVEQGFYDFLFRDGFKAGRQHMNGDRALRYARYRYIDSEEGNNFARERRQQQVVDAIREKLARRKPQDVLKLLQAARTLSNHTDTNLTTGQIVWLYQNFHDVRPENIKRVSLQPYMEVFHLRSLTDPGEAVRPRTGDYRQIRLLTEQLFKDGPAAPHTRSDVRLAASRIVAQQPAAALTAAH